MVFYSTSTLLQAAASALLICSVAVNAGPLPMPPLVARQARGNTGNPEFAVTNLGGNTQPRMEVSDMQRNEPELFGLYVLALQEMQRLSEDVDEPGSFYQVSGIHGAPFENWNSVNERQARNPWGGYCQHSTPMFACWHRPYVALYEQQLIACAKRVAGNNSRFAQLADRLRLPYWDWARNALLPDFIGAQRQITITGPNGQETLDHNPLFSYRFHPNREGVFEAETEDFSQQGFPYETAIETLRNPRCDRSGENCVSQPELTNSRLTRTDVRQQTYILLTQADLSYTQFASSGFAVEGEDQPASSLEQVHDTIHVSVGGGDRVNPSGHMTSLALAAFDPVFWMHHCNVDRIAALWQNLNPNSYVDASQQNENLVPFAAGQGRFHTCASARDVENFGYTYPELQSEEVMKATIDFYGGQSPDNVIGDAGDIDNGNGQGQPGGNGSDNSGDNNGQPGGNGSDDNGQPGGNGSDDNGNQGQPGGNGSTDQGNNNGNDNGGDNNGSQDGGDSGNNDNNNGNMPGSGGAGGDGGSGGDGGAGGSGSQGGAGGSGGDGSDSGAGGSGGNGGSGGDGGDSGAGSSGGAGGSGGDGGDGGDAGGSGGSGGSGDSSDTGAGGSGGSGGSGDSSDTGAGGSGGSSGEEPGAGSSPGQGGSSGGETTTPPMDPKRPLRQPCTKEEIAPHYKKIAPEDKYDEYYANIRVANTALEGSFTVHVFLGDYSEDPTNWDSEPNLCGTYSVFSSPSDTIPKNSSMSHEGHKAETKGMVYLTTPLLNAVLRGDLADFKKKTVQKYLDENFAYRITTRAGIAQPKGVQIDGFNIKCGSAPVDLGKKKKDDQGEGKKTPFKVRKWGPPVKEPVYKIPPPQKGQSGQKPGGKPIKDNGDLKGKPYKPVTNLPPSYNGGGNNGGGSYTPTPPKKPSGCPVPKPKPTGCIPAYKLKARKLKAKKL